MFIHTLYIYTNEETHRNSHTHTQTYTSSHVHIDTHTNKHIITCTHTNKCIITLDSYTQKKVNRHVNVSNTNIHIMT